MDLRSQALEEIIDFHFRAFEERKKGQMAEFHDEMIGIFNRIFGGVKWVPDDKDAQPRSPSCTAARSLAVVPSLADRAQYQCEGSKYELFDEMSKRDEKLDSTHFKISEVRATELKPISSTLFDMEPI